MLNQTNRSFFDIFKLDQILPKAFPILKHLPPLA
jgi:hypothetical protein